MKAMRMSKATLIGLIVAVIVIGAGAAYLFAGGPPRDGLSAEDRKALGELSGAERRELEEALKDNRSAPAKAGGGLTVDEWLSLCRNGTPEEVRAALKAGADVNAKDKDEYTPLIAACAGAMGWAKTLNPETVMILIEAGADVNAKSSYNGYTPLIAACNDSGVTREIVTALLKAGADVNAKSNSNDTSLVKATKSLQNNPTETKWGDIITLLLDNGADVNVTTSLGETAITILSGKKTPQIEALYNRMTAMAAKD
jgi:ankyrin repeat protein